MSPPATVESVDVLVILVDFADESRPTDLRYKDGVDFFVPLTVANAQNVFFDSFTSTAARFAQMSHGLLTMTGDVIEVSLAMNLVDSEVGDWRPAADLAATGLGYTPANYDRVAYLVPSGFKDQMGVGGALGTWCWVAGINSGNAYLRESVFAHELGHTLDLEHAHAISSSGNVALLADEADLMGLAEAIHPASVNQWNKGWLDGVRNAVHPLDTTATYDVYPLADTAAQLQVVHIDDHGANPVLGEPTDTLVSFRKPVLADANISLVATDAFGQYLRNTVHVHQTRKSGSKDSYLVKALAAGEQYTTCGLTIGVNAIDATRAEVEVSQIPYAPSVPGVQVWPQGTTAVEAATSVYYDLDVANFDSGTGACEAYYDQELTLPGPGWVAGWPSAGLSITMPIGANAQYENFMVQAPLGTPPGMYNVSLKLTNNGGSGSAVENTAVFPYEVLASPDTEPPTAPGGLVANEFAPNYVVLMWTASSDNEGVATYRVYHNGVLLPDGGNTTAYIDFPPPSGGYIVGGTNGYVVTAIDAAGNESAPSNWAFVGDDLVAPTTPTNLVGAVSWAYVDLDWNDSTDDVGVTIYDIHRDGVLVGSSTTSDWLDTSMIPGATHDYTVFAWDGWGNVSGESAVFQATIPQVPFEEVPALHWSGVLTLVGALVGVGLHARRRVDRSRRAN